MSYLKVIESRKSGVVSGCTVTVEEIHVERKGFCNPPSLQIAGRVGDKKGSQSWLGVKGRVHGIRSLTTRQWTPQILSVAVAAVLFINTFLDAASEEPTLCSDILYLIEQSRSQFSAIRRGSGSEFGDYDTTFLLPNAWYCVILEDVEKSSYKCTWKYPYRGEQAEKTFQRLSKQMRICIGDIADERTDQPVNHPDFYASYYYQLPGGEARVSLKNKGKLMSTLVSVVIDGFREPK